MPPYKTKWKGSQQENLTLDDVSQIVLASKPLDAYPATKAKGKMAMTSLIKVKISSIDPNPMRALGDYPFNADKIETLRRSIKDVGLWEGLIGRQRGNRIELAFGHHRHEAARKELGASAEISVIVRDLSDKQMLQFMGRENLEEYNADFLCMLESWQAANAAGDSSAGDGSGRGTEVLLIVGPEGGISPREVTRLCDAGAVTALLGHHVLRSSTAGPAATVLASDILGRW